MLLPVPQFSFPGQEKGVNSASQLVKNFITIQLCHPTPLSSPLLKNEKGRGMGLKTMEKAMIGVKTLHGK